MDIRQYRMRMQPKELVLPSGLVVHVHPMRAKHLLLMADAISPEGKIDVGKYWDRIEQILADCVEELSLQPDEDHLAPAELDMQDALVLIDHLFGSVEVPESFRRRVTASQ